jgi:tetratricopeptide (TPR) repeat protein
MKPGLSLLVFAGLVAAAPDSAGDLRSLVEKAQTAEQQNRLDDAVSLYKQILQIRPGWASAELNLGLVYHSRGEYEPAIRVLSDALRHQPGLHSALLFRGASYYQTDRPDDAVRDLTEFLRHQPDDPEALPILAGAHLSRGDPGQAALAFAALARVTGDAAAWYRLGDSFAQFAGRYIRQLSDKEAAEFRKALSANTPPVCEIDGEADLTTVRCAAKRGNYESATRTLIAVLAQPASRRAAAGRLGETFRYLAQLSAARVFSVAPDSGWAALLRAQAADDAGQTAAAEKEYRKAADAPGATSEMYVRYGRFQCKHSKFDEGLASYRKALAMDPARADLMGLIGEAYVLQDRPAEAIPYLQKALQTNPRETQIRLYLAQSLSGTGRAAEAIKVLEDAPEDRDGRIHYVLARTWMQQGEPEKARKAMDVFRQRRGTAKP